MAKDYSLDLDSHRYLSAALPGPSESPAQRSELSSRNQRGVVGDVATEVAVLLECFFARSLENRRSQGLRNHVGLRRGRSRLGLGRASPAGAVRPRNLFHPLSTNDPRFPLHARAVPATPDSLVRILCDGRLA